MTPTKAKAAIAGQQIADFPKSTNLTRRALSQPARKSQQKHCAICRQWTLMVWGWLLCWQPLQMVGLCLSCVCRFQASAAAEREAEAVRVLTGIESEERRAA